jgi:acetyl-CoA carboxylase biotin carboxyl carrier protein
VSKLVKSEMAGTILEVKVKVGDNVTAGQEVAVVESMKMEVPLTASEAGTVKAVNKAVGDFLNEGETLVELK